MIPPPPLVAALERIFEQREEAAKVVADLLRAHPTWDARARQDAARRIFATVVLQARLDHRARLLAHAPRGTRAAERLATYLLEEEPDLDAEAIIALTHLAAERLAELRGILEIAPCWPIEPARRLAAERSLPLWLAALWLEELGVAEADALARASNEPGPIAIRANVRFGDREALARRLCDEGIESRPGRWSPVALHLLGEGRPNVFGSASWRAGAFEVQDEGSQLVALCAAPRLGERKIVDYCAGAGGKTLALAALATDPACALHAFDVDGGKLRDLRARLARARVEGVSVAALERDPPASRDLARPRSPRGRWHAFTQTAGSAAYGHLAEARFRAADADVVLVDAPCSSLGTLRRGPAARWRLDEETLPSFPVLQRQILLAASRLARPGGRLIYATCTLRRAENEDVAAAFTRGEAARALGFLPLAVAELLPPSLARTLGAGMTLTLSPHRHGTDGFFVAAWRRGSGVRRS